MPHSLLDSEDPLTPQEARMALEQFRTSVIVVETGNAEKHRSILRDALIEHFIGVLCGPTRTRRPKIPDYGGPKVGNYACKCGRTLRSSPAARNGLFGCRDGAPKIVAKMRDRPQRPKSVN